MAQAQPALTAETLATAGLKVILVEEDPLRSSQREAYPPLPGERGPADEGQVDHHPAGALRGGSTTVNWTSSFRTPGGRALARRAWAGDGHRGQPGAWFAKMEERLAIAPLAVAPNENNDILRRLREVGIPSAPPSAAT